VQRKRTGLLFTESVTVQKSECRREKRITRNREQSGAIIIICGRRGHGPDERGDNRRPCRVQNVTIDGIAVGTASASSTRWF